MDKPRYGDPCNGCGWCCQQELCPVGKQVFGDIPGPCPALVPAVNRYWCGFVLTEDMTRTPTQITIRNGTRNRKGLLGRRPVTPTFAISWSF